MNHSLIHLHILTQHSLPTIMSLATRTNFPSTSNGSHHCHIRIRILLSISPARTLQIASHHYRTSNKRPWCAPETPEHHPQPPAHRQQQQQQQQRYSQKINRVSTKYVHVSFQKYFLNSKPRLWPDQYILHRKPSPSSPSPTRLTHRDPP